MRPGALPVRVACILIAAAALARSDVAFPAPAPAASGFNEQQLQALVNVDPTKARAKAQPYTASSAPPDTRAAAFRVVAISYGVQGDNARARAALEQAYAASAAQNDVPHMAASLINIGITWLQSGNYSRAIESYRRGAALAAKARRYGSHGNALYNLAQAMADLGDPENALRLNQEAGQLYKRADKPLPGAAYVQSAVYQLQLNRPQKALADLDQARRLLAPADAIYGADMQAHRARALASLGRFGEARRAVGTCAALSKTADLLPSRMLCEQAAAELAIASRHPAAARGAIDRMTALHKAYPQNEMGNLLFERDRVRLNGALARLERHTVDASLAAARLVDLEQRILNYRQKVALDVGAIEMERQGKDLSIALLEARNANLMLKDRQQRILTIASFIVFSLIAIGVLTWLRIRQARLRREQRLEERARIARELHDTLLQEMAGTQLALGAAKCQAVRDGSPLAKTLDEIIAQVSRAMLSARTAVWRIRNDAIARGDLVGAVTAWLDQTHREKREIIRVDASEAPHGIDAATAEHLLRIIQEGVNNALRHGNPSRIDVTIGGRQNALHVSVADDGSGFATGSKPGAPGDHWGLIGLRERADRIGGMLDIQSAPGTGTQLLVTVPQ